jgi:hypothetical protein
MNQQKQHVETGGQAVQAGRDVVVHAGMSPEQMTAIMVAMANELSRFKDEALQLVDKRVVEFRDDILKVFSQPGRANPAAFRDPDFQYLLFDAQSAYARSGDEAVRGTLIDIIARRSLEADRNRMVRAGPGNLHRTISGISA